ncbi:MAG: hypothetical protein M5R36_04350 [Deltaproteobacteria bacterium]|nr:hypothetical protein [Deltaproteobacteria bacterium]
MRVLGEEQLVVAPVRRNERAFAGGRIEAAFPWLGTTTMPALYAS